MYKKNSFFSTKKKVNDCFKISQGIEECFNKHFIERSYDNVVIYNDGLTELLRTFHL